VTGFLLPKGEEGSTEYHRSGSLKKKRKMGGVDAGLRGRKGKRRAPSFPFSLIGGKKREVKLIYLVGVGGGGGGCLIPLARSRKEGGGLFCEKRKKEGIEEHDLPFISIREGRGSTHSIPGP